jgi:hypothetical protein
MAGWTLVSLSLKVHFAECDLGRVELTDLRTDDDKSIATLSKTTSQCFDTDKVRLLYIRAQITRIGTWPMLPKPMYTSTNVYKTSRSKWRRQKS